MQFDRKIRARQAAMLLLAGTVIGSVMMAQPAQAGFEWKPPPARAAAPARQADSALPVMPASPATPVESMPLMTPELPEMADVPAPVFEPAPAPVAAQPVPRLPEEELAIQAAMNEGAPTDVWSAPAAPVAVAPAVDSVAPLARPRAGEGRVIRAERPVAPVVTPITQEKLAAPVVHTAPAGDFAVAEGFGRDIPLAIALQQIVPAGYSFGFATGVNPGVRITWEGGKPWNEVLQDALNAHDLAADVTGNAVKVRTGRPLAASMPVVRAPSQIYKAASAPAPLQAGGAVVTEAPRPVQDWRNEDNYQPSYPRRDVSAARERMMQDAAQLVKDQEPSAHDPEVSRMNTSMGDDLTMPPPVSFVSDSAPLPLMTAPVKTGKSYMQLTGLDDTMVNHLDPHEIRYWQAAQGASLREVMKGWAEKAGVQLFWATGPDYNIPADVQMHGTFQNAVTHILQIFDNMHPQPQGQLHTNQPGGPAVLIIDHAA